MQKENNGQDDQYVRQALEALKSGHMKNLVEKIKSTRVIGTSCYPQHSVKAYIRRNLCSYSISYSQRKCFLSGDFG